MKRLLALALVLATPAMADLRPTPRPTLQVEELSTRGTTRTPPIAAVASSVRPVVRRTMADQAAIRVATAIRAPEPRVDATGLIRTSGRPVLRPADVVLAASRTPRAPQGGGLCGRPGLQGQAIAAVEGPGGCGIANPVRITRVAGVELSRPTRMTCDAARALDDWVRKGLLPTIGQTGGGAVSLQVAAGYACRTRNSQAGAKLSEHAKGNAIDISAIRLANGETLSVLNDWGRGSKGRLLQGLWRTACGPFGTVLGPNSDRFHRDHFHFDAASYRSGSYCR